MASRNVTVAGVSRIGPVYTPPASRRHGYGAAVTAACTQDALDRGARQVVLFTDEANPTSNGIYQQLGYRALDERVILRFVSAAEQAHAPAG
jgi:predicted GNAT family acetyltransferase